MFDVEGFLKNNFKAIKGYCWKITKDVNEAELLFSASLERIWKLRGTFRGDSDPEFRKWCHLIIKTILLNDIKSKNTIKRKGDHVGVYDSYIPIDTISDLDNKMLVEYLLNRVKINFKKHHVEIFELYYFYGFTQAELGEMFNTVEKNVQIILKNIRNYLKKIIKFV